MPRRCSKIRRCDDVSPAMCTGSSAHIGQPSRRPARAIACSRLLATTSVASAVLAPIAARPRKLARTALLSVRSAFARRARRRFRRPWKTTPRRCTSPDAQLRSKDGLLNRIHVVWTSRRSNPSLGTATCCTPNAATIRSSTRGAIGLRSSSSPKRRARPFANMATWPDSPIAAAASRKIRMSVFSPIISGCLGHRRWPRSPTPGCSQRSANASVTSVNQKFRVARSRRAANSELATNAIDDCANANATSVQQTSSFSVDSR